MIEGVMTVTETLETALGPRCILLLYLTIPDEFDSAV